jgi:hypothetical protein
LRIFTVELRMPKNWIAVASAVVFGIGAVALIFAPDVVFVRAHISAGPGVFVLAQLYGAALVGFAAALWVGRNAVLGGIYGRGLVLGSFAHALVAVLVVERAIREVRGGALVWTALVVYGLIALGFGWMLFRGPEGRGNRG